MECHVLSCFHPSCPVGRSCTSPSSEGEVGARLARRVGLARRQPRTVGPIGMVGTVRAAAGHIPIDPG